MKKRSFVPDLVIYYLKDAQCDWIEYFRLRLCEQKYRILKKYANNFSWRRKIQVI